MYGTTPPPQAPPARGSRAPPAPDGPGRDRYPSPGLVFRHGTPVTPLAVAQEADAGVAGDATALALVVEVVAGDPQARGGDQHVIGTQPARPRVPAGRAPGVLQ